MNLPGVQIRTKKFHAKGMFQWISIAKCNELETKAC